MFFLYYARPIGFPWNQNWHFSLVFLNFPAKFLKLRVIFNSRGKLIKFKSGFFKMFFNFPNRYLFFFMPLNFPAKFSKLRVILNSCGKLIKLKNVFCFVFSLIFEIVFFCVFAFSRRIFKITIYIKFLRGGKLIKCQIAFHG